MKLIFESLLISSLLYLYQAYINAGELSKYSCRTIFANDRESKAYYIKLNNFPNDNTLYFKMVMKYGRFLSNYMNYGETNLDIPEGNTLSLGRSTSRDSYSYTKWTLSNYYITETYYYSITKPSTTYLYVAPPSHDFYYSTSSSYIDVCSTTKSGIAIGVWVGIGIAVVVIIAVVIVFICCRRARRMRQINTAVVEPIALNAPAVVAPATVVAPSPSPYMPNPTYY